MILSSLVSSSTAARRASTSRRAGPLDGRDRQVGFERAAATDLRVALQGHRQGDGERDGAAGGGGFSVRFKALRKPRSKKALCTVLGFRHKPPQSVAAIGLLALLQRLSEHPQDPGVFMGPASPRGWRDRASPGRTSWPGAAIPELPRKREWRGSERPPGSNHGPSEPVTQHCHHHHRLSLSLDRLRGSRQGRTCKSPP
jgi:hypothetical protein